MKRSLAILAAALATCGGNFCATARRLAAQQQRVVVMRTPPQQSQNGFVYVVNAANGENGKQDKDSCVRNMLCGNLFACLKSCVYSVIFGLPFCRDQSCFWSNACCAHWWAWGCNTLACCPFYGKQFKAAGNVTLIDPCTTEWFSFASGCAVASAAVDSCFYGIQHSCVCDCCLCCCCQGALGCARCLTPYLFSVGGLWLWQFVLPDNWIAVEAPNGVDPNVLSDSERQAQRDLKDKASLDN